MNKTFILAALSLAFLSKGLRAEPIEKDTLRVIDVEEVVVIATPKENRKLRELPISATVLSQDALRNQHVHSMKHLTSVVPNLYIPDYGSRLTSAIYIRGIGSRVNTPSVGMYVDNVPYLDKSAFDFSYADVERIDVLRGPQGTLYGRNTMGGLIRIHSKSPFSYQGTDLRMGAATYGNFDASLTHYHRISSRFAFSAGGFYEHKDGFFKNVAKNNARIDAGKAGGGRLRGIWLPTENFKADLSVSYEYGDQGGYPYHYTGIVTGQEPRADKVGLISFNSPSSYYRGLFNTGLNLEYQAKHFTLSAVTGFQSLKDGLLMDQDFSEADLYTIRQNQRSRTLSEEIVLKSKPHRRWEWTTGLFGFYQWQHTDAPVTFEQGGIKGFIESNTNRMFQALKQQYPNMPSMGMTVTNPTYVVGGIFDTPTLNVAAYHQSTYHDLFIKGLSATLGLRFDYERTWIDYNSTAAPLVFDFAVENPFVPGGSKIIIKDLKASNGFIGKTSTKYQQLLPKVALQYEWNKGNNVFATVSKGFRAGGYSIQMFSDLIQGSLPNSIIDALVADPQLGPMTKRINIDKYKRPLNDEKATIEYAPEYSWNYEVGAHLSGCNHTLTADLSAFYTDTHDQQIARFSPNGLGRTIVNAGRSRSLGAEASVRSQLTESFGLNASYGYTHATFTDYTDYARVNGKMQEVSYKGNFVPFIPRHTLNLGAEYALRLRQSDAKIDRIVFQANYRAAGRIYWTESNNASQPFYGTLDARINVEMGRASVSLWGTNLLDKRYNTFYFESMNRGFAQQGRPSQVGVELRCRF